MKNPFDLRDLFVFAGICAVGYGAYLIYPPSSPIVIGITLFWLGVRK